MDMEKYNEEDSLMHYGILRRSGRYPWGSGKESYQRTGDFLNRLDELKKLGKTEKQIADLIGITTSQLRVQQSWAKSERRYDEYMRAKGLKEKGYSLNEIARQMGYSNESSIRSLLNEKSANKMLEASNIAMRLKKEVDSKGMIDVGKGVERELGISKEKMKQALYMLEMEGYKVYGGRVPQVNNPGQNTTLSILCPPGTEHKEIYNYSKINTINKYDAEKGIMDVRKLEYPASLDINRVKVRYAEDGGVTKDGTIEIRRGVKDLDLGGSHYAQVRILVDNDRYLKGMAVYKDDSNFPDGIDVIFNTNKTKDKAPRDVFKKTEDNLKKDPNNPFGSTIKPNGQSYYDDPNGKYVNPITGKRQSLSLINKKSDEGDWKDWDDALPSQFLSKQSMPLIRKQLALTRADKMAEYESIMAIDNPTIRRHFLQSFADDCDASAVHLKAAALPRQKYQVILPIDSLKDNECYAPNYKDGETLALIRYPHGGTFEIPIVKVNNKNKDAIAMIGKNPKDAICINSKNAERLSGADFDGDFVMALPTGGKINIASKPPLKGLEGFDNKAEYPYREGMKVMKKSEKGREMGIISNLITDMTLKGATDEELTRAVKHSMVVIDAEKHKLDYKRSEIDNGIAALKKKYQTSIDPVTGKEHVGGASTLISRAKGEVRIEKHVGSPKINEKSKPWYDPSEPEGALLYNRVVNKKGTPDYDPLVPEGKYIQRKPETYVDASGKVKTRMETSTKMKEAKDARLLSSGKPQEEVYAEYANSMKALANTARKSLATTGNLKYSPQAAKEYDTEVKSLMAKLNESEMNAPKERQANLLANTIIKAKLDANPGMDKDEKKKIKDHALKEARLMVGAKRVSIEINDREWEAIQKGAISDNILVSILKHADVDILREKATPKTYNEITPTKLNKLKCMAASGYTNSEIAEALGISATAVTKYL